MSKKKTFLRLAALTLAFALLAVLPAGCGGQDSIRNAEAFRNKADILRTAALADQVQEELGGNPAGSAGYAVFFSVCGGQTRASVYSGTGETLEAAWEAAAQAAETALKKGGPSPMWLKADLVYISAVLSAGALEDIGEVFGPGGFRYGLAFDAGYQTALLEAELNTAGIYDYENGGVNLERLNTYLEASGRGSLDALPEEYTAFQCAGWLCDENGNVFQLSLGDSDYGRRELASVDKSIVQALALDGVEYLAAQVQADGGIFSDDGEPLDAARQAGVLSALIRGYRLLPTDALAESIDRAASWLADQIAYTESGLAFLPSQGEITLESSALGIIALADCAEASGNTAYVPICQALGSGILSLLDAGAGTFAHVLDASSLSRKEGFRSASWDSMGAAALCRLYGLTGDSLWLWAAETVLNRMVSENALKYGDLWTAYALREITKYLQDRADYFAFALKNAQGSLAAIYEAQDTAPAGLEMLAVSYETYRKMLDAGYAIDGFAPELLLEVIRARAQRQLDGYLFPEYAMYFDNPQQVLGAFVSREAGMRVSIEAVCRSTGGYYLYSVNYDSLLSDGLMETHS